MRGLVYEQNVQQHIALTDLLEYPQNHFTENKLIAHRTGIIDILYSVHYCTYTYQIFLSFFSAVFSVEFFERQSYFNNLQTKDSVEVHRFVGN